MKKIERWTRGLDTVLASRQWERRICTMCKRVFFAKRCNETKVCRRGRCSRNPLDFLSLSKRRVPLPVWTVGQNLKDVFAAAGYISIDAVDITDVMGNTDLIGAGVQVLEPTLFNTTPPPIGPRFVLQPSVRMHHFGKSKEMEGGSAAFVNACSLEVGGSFDRHLEHLDVWLEALSRLGLFMGDITLLRRISIEDWGNGPFHILELFISYGGLELGDATYGLLPTRTHGILATSDVGFGLERIAWAVSKLPSYFDLLRPITFGLSISRHAHDTMRTVALLALCGVEASNEGVGFQLRKMCRSILDEKVNWLEAHELLWHYHNFWSRFLRKRQSAREVVNIFQKEIDRLIQNKIAGTLKVPRASNETTEAYASRLVYTLGVPLRNIQKVLVQEEYDQ